MRPVSRWAAAPGREARAFDTGMLLEDADNRSTVLEVRNALIDSISEDPAIHPSQELQQRVSFVFSEIEVTVDSDSATCVPIWCPASIPLA